MRKSRRTAHGGRNQNRRNWADLPDDITASILSRLKTVEILRTAQRVCMTWRRICKENSLVWQSIDILDERYINLNYDMDKVCRHVIDLSSGNLVDISIEYIGTDQLLKYLAESSSGIKRLRFVNCPSLTDEGLSEVASKFPLLEDLDFSKCDKISNRCRTDQLSAFGVLEIKVGGQGKHESIKNKSFIVEFDHHRRRIEVNCTDLGFSY